VKAGRNGIAASTESRVVCQQFKTVPKTMRIALRLNHPPRLHRELDNGPEVRFGKSCQAVRRHSFSSAASSST
jgi:hypothetical protein